MRTYKHVWGRKEVLRKEGRTSSLAQLACDSYTSGNLNEFAKPQAGKAKGEMQQQELLLEGEKKKKRGLNVNFSVSQLLFWLLLLLLVLRCLRTTHNKRGTSIDRSQQESANRSSRRDDRESRSRSRLLLSQAGVLHAHHGRSESRRGRWQPIGRI